MTPNGEQQKKNPGSVCFCRRVKILTLRHLCENPNTQVVHAKTPQDPGLMCRKTRYERTKPLVPGARPQGGTSGEGAHCVLTSCCHGYAGRCCPTGFQYALISEILFPFPAPGQWCNEGGELMLHPGSSGGTTRPRIQGQKAHSMVPLIGLAL